MFIAAEQLQKKIDTWVPKLIDALNNSLIIFKTSFSRFINLHGKVCKV